MFHIREKLFLTYILIFSIFLGCISSLVFFSYKNMLTEDIGRTRTDVLRLIGERTNAIKNSIVTISNLYQINPDITTILQVENPNLLQEDTNEILNKIKHEYDIIFQDVNIAYDVVIIGNNGYRYATASNDYQFDELQTQLFYHKIKEKKGGIYFVSSFKDFQGTKEERYVFSASRTILNDNGEQLGVLMINIDEKYLHETYASTLNHGNTIYIVDEAGTIVTHTDDSFRGMNFININNFEKRIGLNDFHIIKKSDGSYLVSNYHDDQTGWTIIEETPTIILFADLDKALLMLEIVILICVIIALFVSFVISKSIAKPMKQLSDDMNKVTSGDLCVVSNAKGSLEAIELSDGFNKMVRELNVLMEEIKKREFQKRQMDLDFLRAQIKPHFLYNTLFSIKCLIEVGKQEQGSDMLAAFISLLKMTLRVDRDFITLEEECESTKKYVELQQFHNNGLITFEEDLQVESCLCKVPALILQPIVENAIFHGIDVKKSSGTIIITSQIVQNDLIITAYDDGIGMNKEQLEKIKKEFYEDNLQKNNSIGLANIDKRIKINFGEQYGLNIQSEYGIGTTITICMPVIYEKKDEIIT